MLRISFLLFVTALSGCSGTSAVDDPPTGDGGAAGGGGGGGVTLTGGSWGNGATGGSGGSANAGTGAGAGSGGVQTKPYYLHPGRTYDHESDYVAWDGQVSFVMLQHKDQTSLPQDEGGAACGVSGGCNEQVTRIESGASVWGKFKGLTGINVQLASTNEAGVGQGVFSACNQSLPAFDLVNSGSGLPGFNNLPTPAHGVAPSDDCEWRVKAVGGFVYFRAVTVSTPAGSGGTGGTGGTGGANSGGTGNIPG